MSLLEITFILHDPLFKLVYFSLYPIHNNFVTIEKRSIYGAPGTGKELSLTVGKIKARRFFRVLKVLCN